MENENFQKEVYDVVEESSNQFGPEARAIKTATAFLCLRSFEGKS